MAACPAPGNLADIFLTGLHELLCLAKPSTVRSVAPPDYTAPSPPRPASVRAQSPANWRGLQFTTTVSDSVTSLMWLFKLIFTRMYKTSEFGSIVCTTHSSSAQQPEGLAAAN